MARWMRVAAAGMTMLALVGTLGVGCAKKRAPRLVADEDRIEWAKNEPSFVVIRKSCRTLDVYRYGQRMRSYPAVFGQAGAKGGRKLFEGDMRTPTGLYSIIGDRWHDRWEHFFLLDYPNAADAQRYRVAMTQGQIPVRGSQPVGIGSAIGIHGTDKPWHNRQNVDWTWGCISIASDNVRDMATLVGFGTPVLILE
jgi:murein L,D-transpeptidase YafK